MPSLQKIVLALAFVASAFAAQISDGQLQQATTTPAIIPVVKQITDGQIQQATTTSTPVAVVAPAVKQITDGQIQEVSTTTTPLASVTPVVKQITDGQIQQVASASITPSVSANATSVTTPSVTAFKGAASLMSYSSELIAVAIGAAAVFAML